jgi:hypothetical protein
VTGHALKDADNLLIKSPKWAGQVPADHPDGRTGRGQDTMVIVFLSHILRAGRPVPILPASPRPAADKSHSCFLVAGKLACSAADGALSTRRARGREFPEEISDGGAPEGNSCTAGPDEGGASGPASLSRRGGRKYAVASPRVLAADEVSGGSWRCLPRWTPIRLWCRG